MNKKIIFISLFSYALLLGLIQIGKYNSIHAVKAPATGWLGYGRERIGRLAGYLQSIGKGAASYVPTTSSGVTQAALKTIRKVTERVKPLIVGARKSFFGKNKLYIVLDLVKDITPSIVQIYKTTDSLRKTLLSDGGKIQQITKIYNNFYKDRIPTYYAQLRANNFLLRETVTAIQKEYVVHNIVSIIHDTTAILQIIVQKGQELLVDNKKLANKLQEDFKTLYSYNNNFSTLLLGTNELKTLRKNNAREKSLITLLPRDIYSLSTTILSTLFGSSKEPMSAVSKKELSVKVSNETQIVKTTEESLYSFFVKVDNIISIINKTLLSISHSKSPMQKELVGICSSLNSPTIHHGIIQSLQHTSLLLDLFIDQIIPINAIILQVNELVNSLEHLLLQLNQSWLVKSTISSVIDGIVQNLHNTQITILELADSLVKQKDQQVRNEITRKTKVGLTRRLYSSPEENKTLPSKIKSTQLPQELKLIEASKPKARTSIERLGLQKRNIQKKAVPRRTRSLDLATKKTLENEYKEAEDKTNTRKITRIRKKMNVPEETTISFPVYDDDEHESDDEDNDDDEFFDITDEGIEEYSKREREKKN